MTEKGVIHKVDSEIATLDRRIWIFQGNPLKYEVYNSLADKNLQEATWLVTRYRDEIHIGDIALIWKARQGSGIYALGDITSNPQIMCDLEESRKYWKSESDRNKKDLRVMVRYKLKFKLTNALTRKELFAIPELRNMEIFRQAEGTNFRVRPSEWQIIRDLLKRKYNFDI